MLYTDKMKKLITAFAAVLSIPAAATAGIVINEVMQSNVYCIMDDVNEFPDSWIELYNDGDTHENLMDYRIGTKKKFDKGFSLPPVVIPAGGHLLIYCDKANDGLHTDFRVDSGSGDIFLFNPDREVVDSLSLNKQPAPDVAYGRTEDGGKVWGYEITPTPGARNSGGVSDVILGEVEFSVPGGVWKDSYYIKVGLKLPDNAPEGAKILYTTDGSEPTPENANVYRNEIKVVLTNKVIRAKAVADGCISRPSNAQSYIFLGRKVALPVVSIAVNEEYLYDENLGIFADGTGGAGHENYRNNWRRPLNIEYFTAEGESAVFNQLGETRVHGGATRSNKLKSMAVYANKRFGQKRFDYEMWPDDKPGITDNKSFILRNGGNDFGCCYMRDVIIQRVIGRHTKAVDWQGAQPAIVFINGNYHGLMNLRERSNEDNIAANYGGLEDIDMFENWYDLKSGDTDKRDELLSFIKNPHDIEEWKEMIDIESFSTLMALNAWVFNRDFPYNNLVMWRRTDGVDGRWRWIVKDCDYGLGTWGVNDNIEISYYDFLNSLTNQSGLNQHGYNMFVQLMQNPEFREYFINLNIVYQGDFLNERTFNDIINELVTECYSELQLTGKRWEQAISLLDFYYEHMRQWISLRHLNMPEIMRKEWNLGNATNISVNNALTDSDLDGMTLRYNDIPLSRGVFDGVDYVGRTVTLSGDNIRGWIVKKGSADAEVFNEPELTFTVEDECYVINAININSGLSGVNGIIAETGKDSCYLVGNELVTRGESEVFDISGRKIGEGTVISLPARGMYIVRTGSSISKIVY